MLIECRVGVAELPEWTVHLVQGKAWNGHDDIWELVLVHSFEEEMPEASLLQRALLASAQQAFRRRVVSL